MEASKLTFLCFSLFGYVLVSAVVTPTPSHSGETSPPLKTIEAEGIGSDPATAVQDAARNALTNVVGSFIDATKLSEKRNKIEDGIKSQTTQIRTDIKDYSQGSIQSFEILKSFKENGLTHVVARVTVRMEDFKAYVKKLAEGESTVNGSGLFAQIITDLKQRASKRDILADALLPVMKGEVTKFAVSPPQAAENGRVRFTVTASLDQNYLVNLNKTLNGIGAKRSRPVQTSQYEKPYERACDVVLFRDGVPGVPEDWCFVIIKSATSEGESTKQSTGFEFLDQLAGSVSSPPGGGAEVVKIENVRKDLVARLPFMNMQSIGRREGIFLGNAIVTNLEVALLDGDGDVLQTEIALGQERGGELIVSGLIHGAEANIPWQLFAPLTSASGAFGTPGLYVSRTFDVHMKVTPQSILQAKTIKVTIVPSTSNPCTNAFPPYHSQDAKNWDGLKCF